MIYIRQIIEKNIDELKEKYTTLKNIDKTTVLMVTLIEKFGIVQPIVINTQNEIIDGNARFNACKLLGKKEIPVIVKEFKDTQEEIEFMLSCNLSDQYSSFNADLLYEYLMRTTKEFQEVITGYIVSDLFLPTSNLTLEQIEKIEQGKRNQNKLTDFFGE